MADALIALTPEEADYLTGPNGVPRSKITIIPVGVNLDRFTPLGLAMPRTRRLRLVTVGRLVARKGVDTVIEALAALPDRFDVELKIAGGPAPDNVSADSAVRALQAHIRKHEVTDRVEILGRVPHSHVPELLRSADIFVCAPHYEPFGTAALEAAACGIPVVASNVGGLREHVIDNVTGRLVAGVPNDPGALAETLAELLDDPHRRKAMGTAGAAHAAHFAWPHITNKILTTYQTTLTNTWP